MGHMGSVRSKYGMALAAFAAALAVCAVCAGAAFATESPEWQQGKAKLSEAAATKSKGKVTLYDEGVPAEVECESSGEGTAGPGAVDKTTSWTLLSCKATPKAINRKGEEKTNLCEKALSAEIEDLSWRSELGFSGKSIFDDILGESGFAITCETDKVKITDKCVANGLLVRISANVTNVSGGVDEAFDSGDLVCTIGGDGGGVFETTQLVEATKGAALEANIV